MTKRICLSVDEQTAQLIKEKQEKEFVSISKLFKTLFYRHYNIKPKQNSKEEAQIMNEFETALIQELKSQIEELEARLSKIEVNTNLIPKMAKALDNLLDFFKIPH